VNEEDGGDRMMVVLCLGRIYGKAGIFSPPATTARQLKTTWSMIRRGRNPAQCTLHASHQTRLIALLRSIPVLGG